LPITGASSGFRQNALQRAVWAGKLRAATKPKNNNTTQPKNLKLKIQHKAVSADVNQQNKENNSRKVLDLIHIDTFEP